MRSLGCQRRASFKSAGFREPARKSPANPCRSSATGPVPYRPAVRSASPALIASIASALIIWRVGKRPGTLSTLDAVTDKPDAL